MGGWVAKWGCVEGSGRWPGWVIEGPVVLSTEVVPQAAAPVTGRSQLDAGASWQELFLWDMLSERAKWGPVWGTAPLLDRGAVQSRWVVRMMADQGWEGTLNSAGRRCFGNSPLTTETLSRWQKRTHSRKPQDSGAFRTAQGISECTGTPLSCLEEIPVASGDSTIWGKLGLYNNLHLPVQDKAIQINAGALGLVDNNPRGHLSCSRGGHNQRGE